MATAFGGPLCRFFAATAAAAAPLRAGVEAWRRDLADSLQGRLPGPLDWSEDPAQGAVVHDLGDAGWIALRLFAFYADRSELELPDLTPALLELDRDYRAAADAKFAVSRYGHLLACRAWLPLDFHITLRAPLPDGDSAELGSLAVLHDQLRWLNQRTFQCDEVDVAAWRTLPAPAGGELLAAARRGFAGLWAAVQWARERGLPVVVREP